MCIYHVPYNLILIPWFHSDFHKQILRVIFFQCDPILNWKSGATFRMMTRWCQVKSGLTTLIFDFNCSCTYDVTWLGDLIGWRIRGQNRNSQPAVNQKTSSQKNKKLPYETLARNQNLKHSSKTFVQSPHLNCQFFIQIVSFFCNFPTFKLRLLCWFAVNIIISSTFDLFKQIWFPLARNESQIEGFLDN